MKVKHRTSPAALPGTPASKPKKPHHRKPTLEARELDRHREVDAQLKAERGCDWKGLAAVSNGPLFGAAGTPVATLAARYGLPQPPPRPLEKFLEALAQIDSAVRVSTDPKEVAAALMTHDSRRDVFRLEGQLRLYRRELGDEGVLLHDLVKELEDHLGAVSEFELARTSAIAAGADPRIVDFIATGQSSAREAVVDLVARKWLPGNDGKSASVAHVASSLASYDFGTPTHDRAVIAQLITRQIDRVQQGLPTADVTRLEPLHALRRQLRWLALYMEGSGGLVQTDGTEVPGVSADEVRRVRGEGLPPVKDGDQPILMPTGLHYQLQLAIQQLGEIKDDVERRTRLQQAQAAAGVPPAEIEKLLGPIGTLPDMQARGQVIHDRLVSSRLLEQLKGVFDGVEAPKGKKVSKTDALLTKYRVSGDVSHPAHTLLKHLAFVDSLLSLDARKPADLATLVSSKTRRELFKAEAALDLYQGVNPSIRLAKMNVSRLQYAMGEVQNGQAMLKRAEGAPPAVQGYVKGWLQRTVTALDEQLRYEWGGQNGQEPLMGELVKAIAHAKLATGKDDTAFLRAQFADELARLRGKTWPADSLNDGIHELRRELRWVARRAEGLGDFIELEPGQGSTPEFRALATDAAAKHGWKRELDPLGEPRKHAVKIPEGDWLGLLKTLDDLGAVKDDREPQEFLARAYRETGLPVPAEYAAADAGLPQQARAVYQALERSRLLEVLQHAFAKGK